MQVAALGQEAAAPLPRVMTSDEPRILVIDDDPGTRDLIVESLRTEGFRAIARRDSLSGLVRLMSFGADAVVLDWRMPGLDGFDLLETLRRGYPDVPVVFMTGHASPVVVKKALAAGAFSVLVKPFRLEDLVAQVRRATGAWPSC